MHNTQYPDANVAKAATQRVAARYIETAKSPVYDIKSDRLHVCVLSNPSRSSYVPSRAELAGLRYLAAVDVNAFGVSVYAVAHIMGVHFRAGE